MLNRSRSKFFIIRLILIMKNYVKLKNKKNVVFILPILKMKLIFVYKTNTDVNLQLNRSCEE